MNSLEKIKYELRSLISLYPRIFFTFLQLKKRSSRLAVNQQTQIVIEGFPRSANSFAVGAFELAQGWSNSENKIANHLHAPAQIILGTRKQIPTLVLIRNPKDAVLSFKSSFPESPISLSQLLRQYINFYNCILPYKNQYTLGFFEDVVGDFGSIIKKINQQFKTEFIPFIHTEENQNKVFQKQGEHSRPNVNRKELKQKLKNQLESEPSLRKLLQQANQTYEQFQ